MARTIHVPKSAFPASLEVKPSLSSPQCPNHYNHLLLLLLRVLFPSNSESTEEGQNHKHTDLTRARATSTTSKKFGIVAAIICDGELFPLPLSLVRVGRY